MAFCFNLNYIFDWIRAMKKYLITGGFGFIGSRLASKLKNNLVDVLDFYDGNLIIHRQGIVEQKSAINIRYNSYDTIFHLAAVSSINSSYLSPIKTFEVNVFSTIKLLQSIKSSLSRDTKLIFASSFTVHDKNNNHYSLSKKVCEQYCEMYRELHNINVVIVRIGNVYGGRKGIINSLIEQRNQNTPLIIPGDGNQTRDFIHVDDVVSGLIEVENLSGTFELCTGITKSLNDIANLIGGEKLYAPNSLYESFHTNQPNIPNWQPKISLEEYLKKQVRT